MGERNISARCSGHKKTKSHTSARGASSVGVRAHTGITPCERSSGCGSLKHAIETIIGPVNYEVKYRGDPGDTGGSGIVFLGSLRENPECV